MVTDKKLALSFFHTLLLIAQSRPEFPRKIFMFIFYFITGLLYFIFILFYLSGFPLASKWRREIKISNLLDQKIFLLNSIKDPVYLWMNHLKIKISTMKTPKVFLKWYLVLFLNFSFSFSLQHIFLGKSVLFLFVNDSEQFFGLIIVGNPSSYFTLYICIM